MPGVVFEYIGCEGCILVYSQSIKGMAKSFGQRLPRFDKETLNKNKKKRTGEKSSPKRRCFCIRSCIHILDSEALIITERVGGMTSSKIVSKNRCAEWCWLLAYVDTDLAALCRPTGLSVGEYQYCGSQDVSIYWDILL
jgi:hypothetical protein